MKLKNGNIRACAPWCGGGCTLTEKRRAERGARSLVKRLGPDWKPRVWENLGWHYGALNGPLYVFPGSVGFHAFLNDPDDLPTGRWVGHEDTLAGAVAAVLAAARADVAERQRILDLASRVRMKRQF